MRRLLALAVLLTLLAPLLLLFVAGGGGDWGGPLGIARDWHASVRYDPATGVGWSDVAATYARTFALLCAGFPEDRDACALESQRPDRPTLYYTWNDLEAASGKLANLLVSLRLELCKPSRASVVLETATAST